MNWKFKFKSLKTKLIFWFLAVAIAPLLVVNVVIYYQRVLSIKEREFNKLEAIREFKVNEINNWLDNRIGDIETISEDEDIRRLAEVLNKERQTQEDLDKISIGRRHLKRYVKNYAAFAEVFLVHASSGKIAVSSNEQREGEDRSKEEYITEPLRTGKLYIKDVYYSKTLKLPSMTFSIPVFYLSHDDEDIMGILVARIDLECSLYDLLLNRTGMGKTGETLIVNNDILALNELRWYEHAPLRLKIDTEPAVLASRGKTGVIEATDYRGERVLAAYTHIPRTDWGFVAKQDLEELYAPIKAMLRQFLLLLLLSALGVFILALVLAKNIARPVFDMTEVARKIQQGDLSARNLIQRADELGYLANVFNDMADSIQSRMRIQQGDMDISETMVAAKSPGDFSRKLFRKLAEITNSNMAVFYLYVEAGNKFEHCDSIGVNAELLEPFDAGIHEGELGKVLATHKISHIKNIPEDTKFKFKAVMGTAIPREIVTIPLVVDNKVLAVISLASLREYSKECLDILDQSWVGLNTAFSNLLANAETERLAHELGSTNQELQVMNEELRSQSEELQQQTGELKKQAAELEAQRIQVEEADRLKSVFLSNMSHELRTPLNSIMALSQLMLSRGPGKKPEQDAEYLNIIERNGRSLLSLINDILDLSKIESGRMEMVFTEFEPRQVINRTLETIGPMAEKKGLELQLNLGDLPAIRSDEDKVHQILLNILSNAVKFTERGKITVTVSASDDLISFAVSDTGVGIPEDDQARIFDEFRQVDGSSTRRYEGAGLGLAISQKQAGILGGWITVQSRPGEGSVFTLILPLRYAEIVERTDEAPVAAREWPAPPVRPLKRTILVIDDEQEVCDLLKEHLEKAGYHARVSRGGEEGLRLATAYPPDAIILDLMMPDMDGFAVLDRLRSQPATREVPVIILTAKDLTKRDRARLKYSVHQILTKGKKDRQRVLKEIEAALARLARLPAFEGTPEKPHILVVEDNEVAAMQIRSVLEDNGYIVTMAPGGAEALESVKRKVPDAVILDLMMPEIDGFQVLEQIRSTEQTVSIPVLVLTAKELTPEDRARLRDNNIRQFIQKGSLDRDQLAAGVGKLLGKKPASHRSEPETPVSPTANPVKTGKTILVVEDNPDHMITITAILDEMECRYITAEDGEQALKIARQSTPGLILMDIQLPVLSGLEVTRQLKADLDLAHIPVVALTAKVMKGDREKILASGCDDYVSKPVDPEEIMKTLWKWIA